jgi:kojibiose phosphorylase
VWTVSERVHAPGPDHHAETVYTVGNGYLCTRGTPEESGEDQWRTTFAHGVFDPVPLFVTELANLPDWTSLAITIAGEVFDTSRGEIVSFLRELDLRDGTLTREVVWRSPRGLTSILRFERFASLADEHLVALRVEVTPERAAPVRISSPLHSYAPSRGDGTTWVQHASPVATLVDGPAGRPDTIGLHVRTMAQHYEVAVALRHHARGDVTGQAHWELPGAPALVHDFAAGPAAPATLAKVGAYQTSRDGEADVAAAALRRAREAPTYEDVLAASRAAWARRWAACDVEIEGDDDAQLAVRFGLYHLIIAAPAHDDRVNIGAKTLSGFGYRGHVFWDTEIFMLPFFTYTMPDIARNLLDYRCTTSRVRGPRRRATAARARSTPGSPRTPGRRSARPGCSDPTGSSWSGSGPATSSCTSARTSPTRRTSTGRSPVTTTGTTAMARTSSWRPRSSGRRARRSRPTAGTTCATWSGPTSTTSTSTTTPTRTPSRAGT